MDLREARKIAEESAMEIYQNPYEMALYAQGYMDAMLNRKQMTGLSGYELGLYHEGWDAATEKGRS